MAKYYGLFTTPSEDRLIILPLRGIDADEANEDAEDTASFDERVGEECLYIAMRYELEDLQAVIKGLLQGEEDE